MINCRPFASLAKNFSNLIGFAFPISAACVLLILLFIENICLSVVQPLGGKLGLGDFFALHSRGETPAVPKEIVVALLGPSGRAAAGFMGDELPMGASLHPTAAGGQGKSCDYVTKVGKSWLEKSLVGRRELLPPQSCCRSREKPGIVCPGKKQTHRMRGCRNAD